MTALSGEAIMALGNFRRGVQDLKSKSQTKITALTTAAEQQHDSTAEEIVNILESELRTAEVKRLQPLLSLVDCILKKVGRNYKRIFCDKIYELVKTAHDKSDAANQQWMKRMLTESWQKHEVLPDDVIAKLFSIWDNAAQRPATIPEPQMRAQSSTASVSSATTGQIPKAAAATRSVSGSAPPVPLKPVKSEATPVVTIDDADDLAETEEVVQRRLRILTKIVDRKSPTSEELTEIMKVPEIRVAIAMQQRGQRQEAMALLSKFKHDLEKRRVDAQVARAEAAAAAAAASARAAAPRQDPRQRAADGSVQASDTTASMQPGAPVVELGMKRAAADQLPVDPRNQKVARTIGTADSAPSRPPRVFPQQADEQFQIGTDGSGRGMPSEALDVAPADAAQSKAASKASNGHAASHGLQQVYKPARPHAKLPFIGFSDSWMRQFLEQMPPNSAPRQRDPDAPAVGRRVLCASGDQMVYVDELHPNEVLMLMQYVFLLEEHLRKTGMGSTDLTHRIPHSFSASSGAPPSIDVMTKKFFDDYPYQCSNTGLRFVSREKLRKHHDALFKRRNSRAKGSAESRGWMESIPEWVGNRDLVVGPAFFRQGAEGGDDAPVRFSETAMQDDADEAGDDGSLWFQNRWACPADERRSICPISGEPFTSAWNDELNCWVFTDAVAIELGSDRPLEFLGNPNPPSLSETAVLFKRSCFLNTDAKTRREAAEGAAKPLQLGALDDAGVGRPRRTLDPALAALTQSSPVERKHF